MKQLNWKDTRAEIKAMADCFMVVPEAGHYILGTNAYGAATARWLKSRGAFPWFIDNWHKERRAVSERFGIPVFDVDTVASLISA